MELRRKSTGSCHRGCRAFPVAVPTIWKSLPVNVITFKLFSYLLWIRFYLDHSKNSRLIDKYIRLRGLVACLPLIR